MRAHEAHVERLIGRRVHDATGRAIGRIEELIVEIVDGEHVVTEFHLGPMALLERLGGFMVQLPLLASLPYVRRGYAVRWDTMDLTDPMRPRVRLAASDLQRIQLNIGR